MLGALGLALGMLISGTLNTISNEFMDKAHAWGTSNPSTFWGYEEQQGTPLTPGQPPSFNHPFVQAWFMFIGEGICLILYFVTQANLRRKNPSLCYKNRHGYQAIFCYALTACCDMTATSLMYAGLVLSNASIYQMLRGAIIVFTGILSVVWLKKKLYAYNWTAILLVVVGVCIVGIQSIVASKGSSGGGDSGLILGMGLILAAQGVQSVQVVAQEKFIRKYNTPDLLLVGLEGCFGTCILGVLLIPMAYIKLQGYPIENVPDALKQVQNSPSALDVGHPYPGAGANHWNLPVGNAILFAIIGNIASIAFFNVFGIKITTVMSGAHRMVLDSMRTCLVWGLALILGWEDFHILQLVGFVVMIAGIFLYNEVFRLPSVFFYPEKKVPGEIGSSGVMHAGDEISMLNDAGAPVESRA